MSGTVNIPVNVDGRGSARLAFRMPDHLVEQEVRVIDPMHEWVDIEDVAGPLLSDEDWRELLFKSDEDRDNVIDTAEAICRGVPGAVANALDAVQKERTRAARIRRLAGLIETLPELDMLAQMTRHYGLWHKTSKAIRAADQRIVASVYSGVVMTRDRAQEYVTSPNRYRYLYRQGYREVK